MYEEKVIRIITAAIGVIKRGEKAPADTNAGKMLNQLKTMNMPMYEDLLEKYKAAVESYNMKNA